jgi:signal transduction histidine kinase
MNNRKLSFAQRIVLLHFFAMLIIVASTTVYFQTSVRMQVAELENKRAVEIADGLAGSLPVLLELGLSSDVKSEINKTMNKDGEVSSISVLDNGGNVISRANYDVLESSFDVSVPIFTIGNQKKIGSVNLSYSKREYNDIVSKQARIFVLLLLASIIFATFTAVYIRKKLLPLHELANELNNMDMRNPKLTVSIPKDSDELTIIHSNIQNAFTRIADYQAEIYEVNERLEQQVEARTESLKRAIKELQDKENMLVVQSRFSAMGEMIANIAHQWRQPLNIIKSSISLVIFQRQMGKLTDESFEQGTEGVIRQVDYLSQTIEDFREFYRDDEQTTFSLTSAIKKSLDLLSASLINNFIAYDYTNIGDITIMGSQSRLVQVFVNIINNSKDAILSNKVSGVVVIDFYVEKGVGIVEIMDNAGGISDDVIGMIFEPYFTTKHKSQGTGLGLYMSKQIVEKNFHAKISASNKQFHFNGSSYYGACFKIEINGGVV